MDKRYDPVRYTINKYIGNYDDMCLLNVYTSKFIYSSDSYTLCITPDCTIHLFTGFSFTEPPNHNTIPAKILQTFKIRVDYVSLTLYSFSLFYLIALPINLRFRFWPYSWLTYFITMFSLFFFLQYFTFPSLNVTITTFYGKKYKFFTMASRRSKNMQKIKLRIKQLYQSRIEQKDSSMLFDFLQPKETFRKDKPYNTIKYTINKYIGNYDDMCLLNISAIRLLDLNHFYTLCLEPDCTVHLINSAPFFNPPNIKTIPAHEMKLIKVCINYFAIAISSFCFSLIAMALLCLSCKIWPYSYISCVSVSFLLFFLLQYFTFTPHCIFIKTYCGEKYKLDFRTPRRSKQVFIIKYRIWKFYRSRKK